MSRIAALRRIVGELAHFLPAQAPLEVFVHHNTLHPYQHLPFHDALAAAFDRSGANGYLDEPSYREKYRGGRILDQDIDASLERWLPRHRPVLAPNLPSAVEVCRLALIHDIGVETRAGLAWELSERRGDTHFAGEVSQVARNRILRESSSWLEGELDVAGPRAVAHHLVGTHDVPELVDDELEIRFGRKVTAKGIRALLRADPEAAAIGALWQASRRIAARLPSASVGRQTFVFPREAVLAAGGDDPNELVHPVLISFAAAFLDRGQSLWSMPDRDQGFLIAFRRVLGAGHAVRPGWLAGLGARLRDWEATSMKAEETILLLLDEIGIGDGEHQAFLERLLLSLPGWAGMFHRLESSLRSPGANAPEPRLLDFIAVRLTLHALALREVGRRLGHHGPLTELTTYCSALPQLTQESASNDERTAWPLFRLAQYAGLAAPLLLELETSALTDLLELLSAFDRRAHLRVWQEAFERRYREELLHALCKKGHDGVPDATTRDAQLVFCIDDRNESIRRHIEEVSSAHATYATAGFFNLAIAYQGIDDPTTFPLCPVVVTPRHRIEEEPLAEHAALAASRQRRRRWVGRASSGVGRASRSLILGPIVISILGFLATLPLLARIFAPWFAGKLRHEVEERMFPKVRTQLSLPRASGDGEALLHTGFTIEEKAERVGTLLENIGLTTRAELVAGGAGGRTLGYWREWRTAAR
jgi:uncharacterized protein